MPGPAHCIVPTRMWIPVWDGSHQLWVNAAQCYLANGELAFVNESIPTPLPAWLETPPDSNVRMSVDDRHEAGVLQEHRSMRAPAEDILAFYRNCIERGGLELQPDWTRPGLPGRCSPGFLARSARDHFVMNVYQWRDLAFWTVSLSHNNRRRKSVSVPLTIVNRTPDKITLWIANDKRRCWAPASAVSTTYPLGLPQRGFRKRRELDVMPPDSLPSWLRFSISDETPTVLLGFPNGGPIEEWTARILLPPSVDPYLTFENWLDHLDACGLDATGASPDSYYLTVAQQGQILSAQVVLGAAHQGGISLLNSREKSITARFVIRRTDVSTDSPGACPDPAS